MEALLKKHNVTTDMQLYQLIADTFLYGRTPEALILFNELPTKNKIFFIQEATIGEIWYQGLGTKIIRQLFLIIIKEIE